MYLKDFIDWDGCNLERPTQRRRRDGDRDDDKPSGSTPTQALSSSGKVCYGEIRTITGGQAPSLPRNSSSSGSSRGAYVMSVEAMKPRLNDAISFNQSDSAGVQVPDTMHWSSL